MLTAKKTAGQHGKNPDHPAWAPVLLYRASLQDKQDDVASVRSYATSVTTEVGQDAPAGRGRGRGRGQCSPYSNRQRDAADSKQICLSLDDSLIPIASAWA